MSSTIDDASRLRALAALDLIDSLPEAAFDALATLAAQLLDCPIGMVVLIDRDHQWTKAGCGTSVRQVARSETFCTHTIGMNSPLIVDDAIADPRFANLLPVTGPTAARAYAGLAISSPDPDTGRNVAVGAVCGIDTEARGFEARHTASLDHLRTLAEALFEGRAARLQAERQAEALRRSDRSFRQAERMAQIGSWRLELDGERVTWSEGVFRVYDLEPAGEPPLAGALDFYPPRDRALLTSALARTIETGTPFDLELDFVTAKGRQRRVRSLGEIELKDGLPHAVAGVFQDVTERHAVEQALRRSARVDGLTRICNRAAFTERMERAFETAREEAVPMGLILIDLDHFKQANDSFGHLGGDDVLRAVARRLERVGGDDCVAARLGGDEFALLVTGDAARSIDRVADRALGELARPVRTGGGDVIPTSSTIGYACLTEEVDTVRMLVHRADTALYQAKRTRRGTLAAWGRLRSDDRGDGRRAA